MDILLSNCNRNNDQLQRHINQFYSDISDIYSHKISVIWHNLNKKTNPFHWFSIRLDLPTNEILECPNHDIKERYML